jgi:hypothetical protein
VPARSWPFLEIGHLPGKAFNHRANRRKRKTEALVQEPSKSVLTHARPVTARREGLLNAKRFTNIWPIVEIDER